MRQLFSAAIAFGLFLLIFQPILRPFWHFKGTIRET